jgi:hypothetical protein
MSISKIKNQLHSAIEGIDNKELLEAVLTIITSQATTPEYTLTEKQIKILNEREEKYLNGETKTSTLEEFRSKMNDKYGL